MNANNRTHNAVEVYDLEKRFGDFVAVNRISFQVAPGRIFGFLGPNGAGKSTTIKMLCGILKPTSGTGYVGGFNISSQQEKIKHTIGYMSQRFSLYEDLTVDENISFYSGLYNIPKNKKKTRRDWIVQMAGLENFTSNLTKNLSIGWKQRLALGCAIIHEPKIIFLDEPTAGVDPIARGSFWNLIKEMAKSGATVFVTTHYMDEAENCDHLALIFKGSLIATGTPLQLKTSFMNGDCLKITIPEPEKWLEKLAGLDVVTDAALFETDIHAIVSDAASASPVIKGFLDNCCPDNFSVTKIQPTLEDVFVSLIEKQDSRNESEKS